MIHGVIVQELSVHSSSIHLRRSRKKKERINFSIIMLIVRETCTHWIRYKINVCTFAFITMDGRKCEVWNGVAFNFWNLLIHHSYRYRYHNGYTHIHHYLWYIIHHYTTNHNTNFISTTKPPRIDSVSETTQEYVDIITSIIRLVIIVMDFQTSATQRIIICHIALMRVIVFHIQIHAVVLTLINVILTCLVITRT